MIKILYDHEIFTLQKYGGISRYFKFLIDGIKKTSNITYKLGILKSNNHYIKDETQPLKYNIFSQLFKSDEKVFKRNNSYSKYLVKKSDFSILHQTYYNPYLLKYIKNPLVITVHDMTHEVFPHFFPSTDPTPYYKRIMIERADKIIAISETTKEDILKFNNINENKIDVIYPGINSSIPVYESIPNLPDKYILYVGGRWSYKNFHLLISAFKQISLKYPDLKLILAGGGPITYGNSEFLMRNGVSNKIIQMSVNDYQLNTLYKNALCFVYPSLYEGFGLPILEAFKNNCPVLLSNNKCFKEIGGNATNYFETESVESLIEELEKLIENQSLKEKLKKSGSEKLLDYPIERCVSKTISLYKELND